MRPLPREFIDSNVLVYAFTTDPRAAKAQARPDMGRGARGARRYPDTFSNNSPRRHRYTHTAALRIAEPYGYSIFDTLIVASALGANCGVLWSEDTQDGIIVDARLCIANPLRAVYTEQDGL